MYLSGRNYPVNPYDYYGVTHPRNNDLKNTAGYNNNILCTDFV